MKIEESKRQSTRVLERVRLQAPNPIFYVGCRMKESVTAEESWRWLACFGILANPIAPALSK